MRDMAPPWGELSSLKFHFLILRPISCKSAIIIFRYQLKMFDPNKNYFPLSSMFSFQNVWPIKRKAVCYTVYIVLIHCLDQIGSELAYFLNYLLNFSKLQARARGKKCCFSIKLHFTGYPLIRRTL